MEVSQQLDSRLSYAFLQSQVLDSPSARRCRSVRLFAQRVNLYADQTVGRVVTLRDCRMASIGSRQRIVTAPEVVSCSYREDSSSAANY